ncbi:serine carboxypeptidase-like 18 isoform X2 [Mangifera indica]|uniref:serine carboxypeptidase-like 18 isoform X2 n=1 Tax=Mangifera indica TaxID=29780 RepID=UPI001CFA79CC|nr:serine carboxypeptidase-like 18 isoform X2 [Mangifera indica]
MLCIRPKSQSVILRSSHYISFCSCFETPLANMLLSFKSSLNSITHLKCLNLRLLLLLILSATTAFAGQIVKYLPGYDGELPFKLETGYISVDESELFYYFIESQGNPDEDPLFLWLTGGPGCSSFHGLIYQIGPLEFDIETYKGGLPRIKYYPYAWTKTASIIFLDAPVGTGFSYSTKADAWSSSDSESAKQSYEFLRKWLIENPKYLAVELFISGDSYSGMIVPQITKLVVEGNEAGTQPKMNLIGYLIGSPRTDSVIDENSKIVFSHRMALISDELYECVKDLYRSDILEPKCTFASPNVDQEEMPRRALQENPANFILSPPKIPDFWCRNFNYALSYMWANNDQVQDALHVRKGLVSDWKRCNKSLSYTKDVLSVVDVHRYLSTKGLQVLVECGDRDLVVPFVGTEKWIKLLNLTVVNDWRPWFVDGQVAGYTIKYSEHGYRLTYATLKGAGHPAPEYKRRICYEMFDRWIHWYPL